MAPSVVSDLKKLLSPKSISPKSSLLLPPLRSSRASRSDPLASELEPRQTAMAVGPSPALPPEKLSPTSSEAEEWPCLRRVFRCCCCVAGSAGERVLGRPRAKLLAPVVATGTVQYRLHGLSRIRALGRKWARAFAVADTEGVALFKNESNYVEAYTGAAKAFRAWRAEQLGEVDLTSVSVMCCSASDPKRALFELRPDRVSELNRWRLAIEDVRHRYAPV
eukprot:CAMPEP_0197937734 /NCGR_PEP_ID=MMETSP1439-20131203/117003_1 /TAXON_ID=66791 /ORGANISM="Gonyaulax spinifera, Strain CCMP409" /LENGTH=220 /DNA_ID=CAMNT_0043560771 /DNA_START=89 /DNA_END=751 /DNA_ORIENTATION=+